MPPRENWPWEEKVRKNTENKLFSDEYHGVNCSLPSQSQTLLFRADHAASSSRVLWSKRLGYVTVRGELTETAWENAVKSCSQVLCSKHADAQTALFKFHRYVFENVKCTVVCVLAGGGGGGGGGGDGPVFVSLFVFWIPRRATRLFVNGFRYFYFIHFVQLFCHYLIKHTYISQKF